jgi:hypothetical protein
LFVVLCSQLAHIGQLRIEDEEEEEEWVDPSGGLLVNIFAACEEGDTEKLAVNLADLQQTEYSIDTPGGWAVKGVAVNQGANTQCRMASCTVGVHARAGNVGACEVAG